MANADQLKAVRYMENCGFHNQKIIIAGKLCLTKKWLGWTSLLLCEINSYWYVKILTMLTSVI